MKKKQKIENSREKRDLNPRDFLFYRIVIPFSVCFLLKKNARVPKFRWNFGEPFFSQF
jgi:hypothetical protein